MPILTQMPHREASAEFWDRDGHYRAGVGVWPDGGTGMELLDGAGTLRGRVGQRPDPPRSPSTVELYGADGAFRVAAGEYPDGAGRINLWDGEGRSMAGPLLDPSAPEDDPGPDGPDPRRS